MHARPGRSWFASCWLVAIAFAASAGAADKPLSRTSRPDEGVRFPADSGVVNALDFGAAPDDDADDTKAIQAALDRYPNGNRIVYLPAGEYLVSDTLTWPAGSSGGEAHKRTILQGQGVNLTTLRVPDATPAFSGVGDSSKAVIWTGGKPAQRFRNAVRDLTIRVGKDNPGAIGLQFNASNQGTVRDVRIVSDDGRGKYGLDLGHTDEIGPLLVRDVEVDGFEVGVRTWWPVNSCTFERVTLRNQTKYGWHNYHQMIFVRGLRSENRVPAIYNQKDSWGAVTLIDSTIVGTPGAETTAGIINQRQLYVRNTTITGYGKAIDNDDKGRDKGDVVASGLIVEDTSHANAVIGAEAPPAALPPGDRTLVEPKESPEVDAGDPRRDWANVVDFGGDPTGKTDSSAALQRAIDSGATTVYLPGGAQFLFDDEVRIRGPVRRIVGLEGRCLFGEKAVWRLVDDPARGREDAPVVILERCAGQSGGRSVVVSHESKRTLVVGSWIGAHVFGRGSGDVFLDDFCGNLDLETPGQHAYCRQLNTESPGVMLTNHGASLWIFGMKTEKIGTLIHTKAGGRTDLAGLLLYSNQGWDDATPAFLVENARVRLVGLSERNYNRDPCSLWFRVIEGDRERRRDGHAWAFFAP